MGTAAGFYDKVKWTARKTYGFLASKPFSFTFSENDLNQKQPIDSGRRTRKNRTYYKRGQIVYHKTRKEHKEQKWASYFLEKA